MFFGQPVFLWGLAALAVPVWLHLSRRRTYRRVAIGTLRFLQEVARPRRRKARLEEIPLLLMRLLALAALVAIFVRPYFRDRRPSAESTELTVLLDASGSVTAEMADEARRLARKAMGRARAGEKVTLAAFSDDVQVLGSLDDYKPRPGAPTRLARVFGWALDRLSAGGKTQAGRLSVIGHFAARDLPTEAPRIWPPTMEVELVPLEPPGVDNASVQRVSLLTPYRTELMEIEVAAALPATTRREVRLEAEGLSRLATLPAGSDRVTLKFRPPRDEIRGWVSVAEGDAWPADNRRPFAVRWVPQQKVLLVDGRPGATPFEGQAYFIDKALGASGSVHGKTPFLPEIRYGLSDRSGDTDLSDTALVAVCGAPDIQTAEARLLREHVERGGGLLVVMDAQWTAASGAALLGEGLLPGNLERTQADEMRHIESWQKEHPAFRGFDSPEGGDLRELRWRDAFALTLSANWTALATLDGGHVLMAEKKAEPGAGPVIVLAHPLTAEWGDLPRQPLFVPLVKNLCAYLAHAETAAPDTPAISPGMTEKREIGVHATPKGGTEVVAADADEAFVAPASVQSVRAAFGLPHPDGAEAMAPGPALADHEDAAGSPWRREWWPALAVALLMLLIAENWFSTRRPAAVPPGLPHSATP